MVTLWSDRAFVPAGISHAPLLTPFWGPRVEPPEWAPMARFDRWAAIGRSVLAVTDDPAEADFAMLPATWSHYARAGAVPLAESFARTAARAGLPLIVFVESDRREPLTFDAALVYRASLDRSARQPNERALPAWSGDYVERFRGGVLPLRPRGERPVVGFCGVPEPRVRADALAVFERSAEVETRFIRRAGYLAGTISWTRPGGVLTPVWDEAAGRRARAEYLDNVFASDYVLCARGAGNFSYRLFETLSCGRVPVLIDTDGALPYDDAVDWKRYVVWCGEDELATLPDRVRAHWEARTPAEFQALQRECRAFWAARLSPEGFFAGMAEELEAIAAGGVPEGSGAPG